MKKAFVVGIAGGSASGKTTLCERLEQSLQDLKLCVIHTDHYFKPEEERPYSEAPILGTMYVDDNHPLTMDLPRVTNDLKKLLEKGTYDVIIVEGILTLWDKDIYKLLDLKLFVDCRADERIVRRLKRNMEWGLSFDQISNVYLDLVRYRHDEYVEPTKWKADFIMNGSHPSEESFHIIMNHIKTSVKE